MKTTQYVVVPAILLGRLGSSAQVDSLYCCAAGIFIEGAFLNVYKFVGCK